jgi:hypothetical protein
MTGSAGGGKKKAAFRKKFPIKIHSKLYLLEISYIHHS